MQVVDFFDSRWYVEYTSEVLFFLFDNGNDNVVRLTTDEIYRNTSVNVHNPLSKEVMFLPVDHNLKIKKERTDEFDSTCDYLLVVNGREQLIFGEIKTGRKGWARAGMMQVLHTIEIFRSNHEMNQWGQCRAYVSNWRKWCSRTSTRHIEEEFKLKTGGLRLYINNDVNIEGNQ